MSKSLNIAYYPAQYFDIAAAVGTRNKVKVSLPTPQAAKALRLDFYGFKRAVREMGGMASDRVRGDTEAVHIRVNGCEVTFFHADDEPQARAITEALRELKLEPPAPPQTQVAIPPPRITVTETDPGDKLLSSYMKKE